MEWQHWIMIYLVIGLALVELVYWDQRLRQCRKNVLSLKVILQVVALWPLLTIITAYEIYKERDQ